MNLDHYWQATLINVYLRVNLTGLKLTKTFDSILKLNNELKISSNVVNQIMQTSASIGVQNVSNKDGVILMWYVKTSSRNSLYLSLSYNKVK